MIGKSRIPTLLLLAVAATALAAAAARAGQIAVGKNYQVSIEAAGEAHTELLMAADPTNDRRLLAVSMVVSSKHGRIYTAVYATADGGQTWRRTLAVDREETINGDPACAFGPDGTAYFCSLQMEGGKPGIRLLFYRSGDGGQTWSEPSVIKSERVIDRPFIAVDTTGGERRGWVYVIPQVQDYDLDGKSAGLAMTVFRSRDKGAHFDPPARLARAAETQAYHPGSAVVLADGTVLSAVTEFRAPPGVLKPRQGVWYARGEPNAAVKTIASRDGGLSLEPAVPLGEASIPWPPDTISTMPMVASDNYSEHFKGRAYAVWADSQRGRSEILFAYSTDGGRTWSRPQYVNDDAPFKSGTGPDDFLPVVAVNRAGVVGVSWYDRREHPDNAGWTVRFAASLDGGETFGPSVRVSSGEMNQSRYGGGLLGGAIRVSAPAGRPHTVAINRSSFNHSGGHTAGLAAAADGTFRPLWVDNRTGVSQAWTASVTVSGTVVPNGSEQLSGLKDVSEYVSISLSDLGYDPATGIAEADIRLKNVSGREIVGPLVVRNVGMRSQAARVIRVMNADNDMSGTGAVWDFTAALKNNRLGPGEVTEPKRLRFQLGDPLPAREGNEFRDSLLLFDARVLAGIVGEAGKVKRVKPNALPAKHGRRSELDKTTLVFGAPDRTGEDPERERRRVPHSARSVWAGRRRPRRMLR